MTPRRKRLLAVGGILAGVGAAAAVALTAMQDNMLYYYSPSQVAAGEAPATKSIRVGGLVTQGSVQRSPGSLEVRFVLTDLQHTIPVRFSGLLPDLFREGQGIIAHGRMNEHAEFVADEVLAKHDENYMPPEVKNSLKKPPAGGST
jgi:cytochrome c-type biogenesis protein CcmE